MGGGGQSRQEREAQERARQLEAERAQREREQTQIQNQFFTEAAKPDPLAERLRAQKMTWLDQTEGKGGPVDVSKLDGMAPYVDLYNKARERREGERQGQGLFTLGLQGSNPNYVAALREQKDAERQQAAAGGLENAFRLKDAEMRDSYMPLVGYQLDKGMGLAQMAGTNASGAASSRDAATQAYLQMLLRPRQPGFFSRLMTGFAQGAGSAAGAAAMGGV